MHSILEQYYQLYNELLINEKERIPLCAAETYLSDFVKQPLNSIFEGKYSCHDSSGNSFIEGKYIDRLNQLLKEMCKKLFNAKYSNADTLTGINCFTTTAMALLSKNNNVLLTTPEQGGHPSIPKILDVLGVHYDSMPYNYSTYQINYDEINKLCSDNKYDFLIFCQSDILQAPDLNKLNISKNTGIIYDATQTLGLIAAKCNSNPLELNNTVLIGGTHKTLPAPACGLVMTNNSYYADKLNKNISPILLRNTQPNHIASLLLALIEQDIYGFEYQSNVIKTANEMGYLLENKRMAIAKIAENQYTNTHQLFIKFSPQKTNEYFLNALKYNISLNKKNKKLFSNTGIRIGVQQIARYDWNINELKKLSELLFLLCNANENHEKILILRNELITMKAPQFTCQNISIE